MNKLFFVSLLLIQSAVLIARDNDDKVPYMTKALNSESISSVQVQTSGGSISVTGVAAAESRIEVYVRAGNSNNNLSKDEIDKRIKEDYELTITVSNNKLSAIAKPTKKINNWNNALSISFKIFVPENVSADLSTSGGSINLNKLSGKLDFSTSGGSLNLDNISGKANGSTSGGSINVTNSKNEIKLSTSGGSIQAKNCEGSLHLTTSGGSLSLQDLKGEIKASTSGGSISGSNIDGDLESGTSGGNIHLSGISGSLNASTSGGNIDISIIDPRKSITIGNSGGNINIELPAKKGMDLNLFANKINTEALQNFSGSMSKEELVGKLNGGGVSVTIKAGSGKINLVLK